MKLSLAEGLYLIALDDEHGRLLASALKSINDGLIAASILDLYLSKAIAFKGGNVQKTGSGSTENRLQDVVLKNIKDGDVIENIIQLRSPLAHIQTEISELLVHRGIIKKEATKLLWIPVSERMDNQNYAYEQAIRDHLSAIVVDGEKPTKIYLFLMSLVYDCHLLEEVFHNKDTLIDAVKFAKDIPKSNLLDAETSTIIGKYKDHFNSLE